MRSVPAAALLVLLAACSPGGSEGTSRPAPSAATAAPAAGQVVLRTDTAVRVMSVDDAHRVRLVRELAAPHDDARPEHLATSSAGVGEVCVVWARGARVEREVVCYPSGAVQGRVLGTTKGPGRIALRADGDAVAWTEQISHQTYPTDNLVVADLAEDRLEDLRRVTSDPERCPAECFQGCSPDALAWAGDEALLLTASCESDDGNPLRLLPLEDLGQGWLGGSSGVEPPHSERPYTKYDVGGTATAATGYAVARGHGYGFDGLDLPERAVRLDLRTGKVLELVATAQRDRYVASVTGSGALLVYATTASFGEEGLVDTRFYARFAGERRGTRLSGLPRRTREVVAFA